MAIEGTAVWAVPVLLPSTNTWSVRFMYSVVPQSLPSPYCGPHAKQGIGDALSAGVNRRQLPSLY
jgi:hypothetical protein